MNKELKNLIKKLNIEIDKDEYEFRENGYSNEVVNLASKRFEKEIGIELDKVYLELSLYYNGILFNGMVIFPLLKHNNFNETIIQANIEFRENLYKEYIYYGSFDEELYVYNIKESLYYAIEYSSGRVFKNFLNIDDMFIYMIKRSLSSVNIKI